MTGFSPQVRAIITSRSGRYCEIGLNGCTDRAVHKHHRRCRGMGSTKRPETNQAANGLDVCLHCHEWVESHRREAYEYGWLVRQTEEPADVPVLYRGTLVILDDLGNLEGYPGSGVVA